ncbi:uncharacterized protein ColSpa_09236 [Colletotrichum spaethianum]|uniref:Uncharacterized protein n=1 Tax=Colletotrichum spaethianum TaxID=700344 RepID=A0AA37PB76_9PEZI|nr:uncharacterized protein ColSpa_09236 [Colletotrichum spaethianum]GKT49055.1 hypothetical protein ColSpa_09236 [Colletotrichum spaethianum]
MWLVELPQIYQAWNNKQGVAIFAGIVAAADSFNPLVESLRSVHPLLAHETRPHDEPETDARLGFATDDIWLKGTRKA